MGKRPVNGAKRLRKSKTRRRPSTAPKEKPFVRSTAKRAKSDEVELVPGRTVKHGAGRRLHWRVFCSGQIAGRVSINYLRRGDKIDASIDVQLNRQSRGRGIGTIVFRRACDQSGLAEVLASIRKGNVASQIAAGRAGFVPLLTEGSGELLMIWRRK